MPAGLGETKIEVSQMQYWNSKKQPASKGDQIIGQVLRCEADEYKGRPTTRYVLKGEKGDITLPNHTVLNSAMARVPVGRTVRIVYLGKGEAARGRSAPELYEVYLVAADETAPAKPPTEPPQQSVLNQIIQRMREMKPKQCGDERLQAIASVIAGDDDRGIAAIKTLKDSGAIHMDKEKGWVVT